jgi:hypothetical protein
MIPRRSHSQIRNVTSTIGLRVQSNLFDATTVMTISGTLSGHPVDLLVDTPISL